MGTHIVLEGRAAKVLISSNGNERPYTCLWVVRDDIACEGIDKNTHTKLDHTIKQGIVRDDIACEAIVKNTHTKN